MSPHAYPFTIENDFELHEIGCAGKKQFHMNGFAQRLILKQRQRVTRKNDLFKPCVKQNLPTSTVTNV